MIVPFPPEDPVTVWVSIAKVASTVQSSVIAPVVKVLSVNEPPHPEADAM